MMKNIALGIVFALIFTGCSKPQDKERNENSKASLAQNTHTQEYVDTPFAKIPEPLDNSKQPKPKESAITENEARAFAQKLYKKMQEDELFINNAFELGEYQTLIKYSNDFQIFASTPYSEYEAKKEMAQTYFPDSPIATPYAICDRALNELNGWNTAMMNIGKSNVSAQDIAYYRQNLSYKEQLYKESKEACHKRINLTYQQAAEAFEESDDI